MAVRIIFVFFVTCIFSLAYSQEFQPIKDKKGVKQTIEQTHQQMTSLLASFTEYTFSDLLEEPQQNFGKLYFKKANKIRWENETNQQVILLKDEKIKIYEHKRLINNQNNQRIVKPLQKMMVSLLSGSFLNEEDFAISYLENTKYYQLILIPKHNRMAKYIREIDLLFSKNTLFLGEITLKNQGKQKIKYVFSQIKPNTAIEERKFDSL